MLYYVLFQQFAPRTPPLSVLNVTRYITSRRAAASREALAVGIVLSGVAQQGTHNPRLVVPFFMRLVPDLGLFYLPSAVFVLTPDPNAVNLTDGLDGRAISIFARPAAAYTALPDVTG